MFRSHRHPFRRKHGAALMEALICLPVFVAALAGVVALNGAYSAKLEAKSRARRLAWLQAESGECPAQSCRNGECGSIEGEIRAEGLDRLVAVRDGRFSLDSLLGDLGRFLIGSATKGVGVAEAASSSLVGAGHIVHHGITTLLCNTTSRHTDGADNVLRQACRTGLESTEYASAVCE